MTPQQLRVQLSLILTLAGLAAFLSSYVALSLGLTSMAVRYALAVVCGYVTFVLLIRGWIAVHRRATARQAGRSSHALDAADAVDVVANAVDLRIPTRLPGGSDVTLFAGGRSGGAGAGTSFADVRSGSASSWNLDLDVDDLWPVFLAVVCVAGGVLALAYVIYSAPVLLAEVAVDAAIMTGLYRQLKKRAPRYWVTTVVRHTAVPALVLVVFAALAGYAAERLAPDARSIGGVIRALRQ